MFPRGRNLLYWNSGDLPSHYRYRRCEEGLSRGGDQVSTVLVLCGAGASSTFLAHALRRQATVRGLPHTFTPASVAALSMPLTSVDVVLVSSHVADFFDQAAIAADAIGAKAIQLPALNFDAAGANIALDLLDSFPQVTTESSNNG
ncbi:PTS sugar transporter subunit IIB [Salinibacterium sp. SWN139]|uniref:PTS sugar transporter subunit IIB n=1 Tax=Salinibacterium sp. SWN139 TaxID=2792055 RepID=UPI001E5C050D|nr:PTS sugar transporter subunit IIC [Salinibacterium sp. SWN139]